jgi:ATP-dependent Clp protease protease subunit
MKNLAQLHIDNLSRPKQPVNVSRTEGEASIYIYDMISADWGVSALSVIAALEQAGSAEVLHVYINSPGGDVFEGRAIMAALERFEGKTIAHIDSLCASAATSIAISCDEVEISDGAFFMIHNASGLAWGDKETLREVADLLEKIEGSIVNDYIKKTKKDAKKIKDWMNAETWFTASEAIENGFVDRMAKTPKASNTWNLASFSQAPAELTGQSAKNISSIEAVIEPASEVPATDKKDMKTANENRLRLLTIA